MWCRSRSENGCGSSFTSQSRVLTLGSCRGVSRQFAHDPSFRHPSTPTYPISGYTVYFIGGKLFFLALFTFRPFINKLWAIKYQDQFKKIDFDPSDKKEESFFLDGTCCWLIHTIRRHPIRLVFKSYVVHTAS